MAIFGRRPVTLVLRIAVEVVGVLAALDFAAQPRAQTRTSPVTADGQTDYLDIPDAAPPVGKLRWKPPRLQLMRAAHPTGSRAEDVSAFSRRLKQLARELDWPVIAVSQLDRGIEQRPGGGDHPDGQPPPLPTDRGDRPGRRASVDRASTDVGAWASSHMSTTPANAGLIGDRRRVLKYLIAGPPARRQSSSAGASRNAR